jgi:hypothetical protein
MDRVRDLAKKEQPKVIVAGFSAYSRVLDFKAFASIAKDVGAKLVVDMAHVAGLVAAKVYPSPVGHADVVTLTTHKTLRGPRGGMILADVEQMKAINSATFPGSQGGPLMHVIAAKAIALREAQQPEFVAYQKQVVENARVLAAKLTERGLRIVSGRTESHVMLVDLRPKGITGKAAEAVLGQAHITQRLLGMHRSALWTTLATKAGLLLALLAMASCETANSSRAAPSSVQAALDGQIPALLGKYRIASAGVAMSRCHRTGLILTSPRTRAIRQAPISPPAQPGAQAHPCQ